MSESEKKKEEKSAEGKGNLLKIDGGSTKTTIFVYYTEFLKGHTD